MPADKKQKKPKTFLQRAWYFLWDDDSALSWVVSVILAFVLIKYLIYPGLGFALGTTHPVVAVVSGSMEHKLVKGVVCGHSPQEYSSDFSSFWETCGSFYAEYGIGKEQFMGFSFSKGFNTGDIIFLTGKKPKDINVGDVIVLKAGQPDPIIHRVISKREEGEKYFFATKGDHNPSMLPFEMSIDESRLIGRAVFRIPLLGYIKIWFVELLKTLGLAGSIGKLF